MYHIFRIYPDCDETQTSHVVPPTEFYNKFQIDISKQVRKSPENLDRQMIGTKKYKKLRCL